MNTILQLCPKCNNHTNIVLVKDNVNIYCQCGYCYTMNIKEFINKGSHNKPNNHINDDTFSDIINDINKGYQHLLKYFKTLKDEHISQLINTIESSYEESYKRNKSILSFIQILIDNYDGSYEMEKNIKRNTIYIYKCKENANTNDLIKYYNEYTIV